MKGFFPNIVSQTELKLSQILLKWEKAKEIQQEKFKFRDGITFRARELLLKYINESDYLNILPSQFEYSYEKKLNPGDLLVIKSPQGEISHSKFGKTNHLGFDTEDYREELGAGSKYLVHKDVRPFEFFCQHDDEIYNFRQTDEHFFDKPGIVKCGVNVRKKSMIHLRSIKGSVEFQTGYLNLEKAISRIPRYIANSKTRIENKLIEMNQKNKTLIEKWVKRAIIEKDNESDDSLRLDNIFQFEIPLYDKTATRKSIDVCGMLVNDPKTGKAMVRIDQAKANYGNTYILKNLENQTVYKTQINFSSQKRQCFPISDKQFLENKFLNAVLFYEP
jgi:hypothetical protein